MCQLVPSRSIGVDDAFTPADGDAMDASDAADEIGTLYATVHDPVLRLLHRADLANVVAVEDAVGGCRVEGNARQSLAQHRIAGGAIAAAQLAAAQ